MLNLLKYFFVMKSSLYLCHVIKNKWLMLVQRNRFYSYFINGKRVNYFKFIDAVENCYVNRLNLYNHYSFRFIGDTYTLYF